MFEKATLFMKRVDERGYFLGIMTKSKGLEQFEVDRETYNKMEM